MSKQKKGQSRKEKPNLTSLFLSDFRTKPKITISQWADTYRFVAEGLSSLPGKWNTDNTPYMREILDIFTDRKVNQVVVMASSQVGKTEVGLNMIGYYSHQEPSAIMYLLPTDDVAKKFSNSRVKTTIESTPVLAPLFNNRSRNAANANDFKSFPGGFLTISGANTPNNLASFPIRILIQDEIDRFPHILTHEGDPIQLARQRTVTYSNAKELLISTPTIVSRSRIWEAYQNTDQREYHVNCPDCNHLFTFQWEQVKWEVNSYNKLIQGSVYIECPACFHNITERERREMVKLGKWIATKPEKEIPGFHISTLYSTMIRFSILVKEYILAQEWLEVNKDPTKMQVFYNLKLGLPYDEVFADLDPDLLARRREFYDAELPEGVLYLTAGVDTQSDRLEYQIIGWGDGYEAWVIQYGVIHGDLTIDKPWNSLDQVLTRYYYFVDGRKLPIMAVFIDSAGNHTNEVYRYTKSREHLNIFAIVGRAGEKSLINGMSRNNIYKVYLATVGVDTGKAILMRNLTIEYAGPGHIHFPRKEECNCDQNYFDMLTAEKCETVYKNGYPKQVWKKIRERNEALDTFVYGRAALETLNPNFEAQRKAVAELPVFQQENVVNKPQERRIFSRLSR